MSKKQIIRKNEANERIIGLRMDALRDRIAAANMKGGAEANLENLRIIKDELLPKNRRSVIPKKVRGSGKVEKIISEINVLYHDIFIANHRIRSGRIPMRDPLGHVLDKVAASAIMSRANNLRKELKKIGFPFVKEMAI